MMANRSARRGGDGGRILLGVRTQKSTEYHADAIVGVRPYRQELVDPKQYYDVLHAWLLPVPEGLDVRWYASLVDPALGIVAITVPPQPQDRWPCLVIKVLEPSGMASKFSIAYVERRGEHARNVRGGLVAQGVQFGPAVAFGAIGQFGDEQIPAGVPQ